MIVVIVLAGFVVMALAAIAGTGRFGEWREPVTDRPKGRMPEGPVDGHFLDEVRIPDALFGYDPDEVREYLRLVAGGIVVADAPQFTVRSRGLDMQFVDEIVARAQSGAQNPVMHPIGFAGHDRMDGSTTE